VRDTKYTETNTTIEFVPDDYLRDVALPHNRTQICHYAIRLTPPDAQIWSSVFQRRKQQVAHGFETEFHFRIVHRTEDCRVAGMPSEWCSLGGGDGFAFVIQNLKRSALGIDRSGLGYSGLFDALAIEFDTWRDFSLDDRT
jgi:hypothetical protein